MQEPVSELAGRAQLVKSARICELTLLLVVPQSSGVAAISCSLVAYSAQVSAQRGRDSSEDRSHESIEFCTIALHNTLVVYLA